MSAGRPDPAPAAARSRVRALVVDDEPSLVTVVAGYLAREGYEVETAADGESALATARRTRPDVVVLDLMLPGIDGVEVCRQLRTFTDAYVIMLTARAEEVDKLIGLSKKPEPIPDLADASRSVGASGRPRPVRGDGPPRPPIRGTSASASVNRRPRLRRRGTRPRTIAAGLPPFGNRAGAGMSVCVGFNGGWVTVGGIRLIP